MKASGVFAYQAGGSSGLRMQGVDMPEEEAAAAVEEFSDEIKSLGDQLAGLTLRQAVELKNYLKAGHGIEPAAGGAVMVAGAEGAAAPEEEAEQTAFDVVITVLWVGVTLTLTLSGVRQNASQTIKSLMTPGLLVVIYGLVWLGQKAWGRSGKSDEKGI